MILLARLYAALGTEGRDSLIQEAATLLAQQHIRHRSFFTSPPDITADQWLRELASDTLPHDPAISRLKDYSLGVEEMFEGLLADGIVDALARSSESDLCLGQYIFDGFMQARLDTGVDLAHPSAYYGVALDKDDFTVQGQLGPVHDPAAMELAVDQECMRSFAAFIAGWRSDFFSGLFAGNLPGSTEDHLDE